MSNTKNPFVLPGMGQSNADLAGNPLFAGLEMMRKAWSSLAGAQGMTQSLPMSPMLNIEELDKRVAELKSVESWLSLNLSMLSSTIQGMEVQRATLTTLRSFVDAASHVPGTTTDGRSPLEVVLGIRAPAGDKAAADRTSAVWPGMGRQAGTGNPAAVAGESQSLDSEQTASSIGSSSASSAGKSPKNPADGIDAPAAAWPGADAAGAASEQVMQASQAWWDMMQQQFQNLAAAAAASVPGQAAAVQAGAAGQASKAGRDGQKAASAGNAADSGRTPVSPADNGPRSAEKPFTAPLTPRARTTPTTSAATRRAVAKTPAAAKRAAQAPAASAAKPAADSGPKTASGAASASRRASAPKPRARKS